MLSQSPTFTPGLQYIYSNQGNVIVGAILEKISGLSWEVLIEKRLFQPLAMNCCGIEPLGNPNILIPDQRWAHEVTDKGVLPIIQDNPESIGPAATIHCSMKDWLKFIQLHIDAHNGKFNLVSASSFAKLHTSYPGQEYTYGGWIKTERKWANGVVFTHDGSNKLNYATVWWAPKINLAVISVSNIGAPTGQGATQETINLLIRRLK